MIHALVLALALQTPTDPLVAQLGDDDIVVRETASAKLRALGDAARPLLEAALRHKDPEIRGRARAILAPPPPIVTPALASPTLQWELVVGPGGGVVVDIGPIELGGVARRELVIEPLVLDFKFDVGVRAEAWARVIEVEVLKQPPALEGHWLRRMIRRAASTPKEDR